MNSNNQNVLFEKKISTDIAEDAIHFSYSYLVLECAGCEKISYRTDYNDIDNIDADGDNYTDIKLFPSSIPNHKPLESHFYLPKKIRALYLESLQCIAANSKIMAAAAFRAIIEGVCEVEKVKGKDLELKIKGLVVEGIISKDDAKRLHSIRFMGNDAVHKLDSVDDDKIMLVLKIVEHLLESLYLLKRSSEDLLEITIDNFDDFKRLLRTSIRESTWPKQVSLRDLLGNSFRRVKDHAAEFEKQLLTEIVDGKFKQLKSLGKIKIPARGEIEHYEVKTIT